MTLTETARGYEVTFEYHPRKVAAVKKIEGSYWIPEKKAWVIPRGKKHEADKLIAKYGDDNAFSTIREMKGEIPDLPELTIDIPLKLPLYEYQKSGVAYSISHKKVLIGDQMGLGKSGQAVATILAANSFPCLVICKATLKENMKREWEKWTNKRALILTDKVKTSWKTYWDVGMIDVFICNYESLPKYFVESIDKPKDKPLRLNHITFRQNASVFKSLIIDEIHCCKDGGSRQSKMVMGLSRGKEYVLGLTGTPVVNKPKDLIAQLHILNKLKEITDHLPPLIDKSGRVMPYKMFTERYCSGKQKASNLKELNIRLNQVCYYHREKKDVLKDLPEKARQVMMCEIDNREEYTKAEKEFVRYLEEVKQCSQEEIAKKLRGEIMVKLGILKSISARGKTETVREFIDEIVESGEKVVVFVHLKEIAHKLKTLYPDAVSVLGEDKMDARQANIDRFQTDPNCQIIICSLTAAGVGLTLTASSRVAFVEFPWTYAACEQAEARCDRIGQKFSVMCTYFLGDGTVDQFIYDTIQKKKNIAQAVTGSTEVIEEEFIDSLLNLFNKNK